jgi:phosphatidylethanolamine/phosphatidyl-N-methylethanolamine N-methyltransferase
MSQRMADYRVFLGEFVRSFHSTGAILPSGRSLARALARHVRQGRGPRKILEIGPGTGAVTRWIIDGLDARDTLDLVELNETFVRRLEERLKSDPLFRPAADRTTIHHRPIEELPGDASYDLIISGLPLNNFAAENVREILTVMTRLLRPGGTMSFFEYVGVRPLRSLISSAAERKRLRGVGDAIASARQGRAIGRDFVLPNVPPAWVHHLSSAPVRSE